MFQKAGKKMAGFKGDVAVDGTPAKVSSIFFSPASQCSFEKPLQEKIGRKIDKVLFKGHAKDEGSPNAYPAKLDGTDGHIVLEMADDTMVFPQIAFVPLMAKKEKFIFPIDDIVELKKVRHQSACDFAETRTLMSQAHVAMARLALGWVSGADVEGLGLTIRFKTVQQQLAEVAGTEERIDGETMHFTRVQRREQLFVRLIAMGRQRWEVL
jgi:hypothetical protein